MTSPQGADHTAGNTVRAKVDHLDGKANIATSRGAQINSAGFDTLGACLFAGFGLLAAPETISELLNARYGWQTWSDVLQLLGKETLTLEREFNRRAGFTAADDRPPEYMRTEPLPPNNSVFDTAPEDLDSVFNW
jgi:aldehyde:ferredoxin oxidoreductase